MAQQIVIQVEDQDIFSSLITLLGSIKGITVLSDDSAKSSQTTSYEKSIDDLKCGRINTYNNPDEFFKKMGI